MKKIDIAINQAKIISFRVSLGEEKPEVSATIGLFAGHKQISDFTIDTNTWNENKKFDLPIEMINPILKIAKQLEHITALHCSSAVGQLTDGTQVPF